VNTNTTPWILRRNSWDETPTPDRLAYVDTIPDRFPSHTTFHEYFYGGDNRFEHYECLTRVNEKKENKDPMEREVSQKLASYTVAKS